MYNFLFLNIRRLLLKSGTDKTKIDFMKDLSNSYTLFICLCETFLNSSILNAEIFMPGFVVCRCDRADRPGGGMCIYIKDSIMFEVCLSYSNSVCELLIIKLDNPSLIIVAIYRPPSSLNSDFEDIITRTTQCFNEMPTPMPNIVVVGDFNLPNFNWDDPNTDCLISKVMCPFIDSFFLKQIVTKPTRGSNILDLVFCHDDLIDSIDIVKTSLSDHCILTINSFIPVVVNHSTSVINSPSSVMESLNFNKCDWELLITSLCDIDWSVLLADLSAIDCFNTFMTTVSIICQNVVPQHRAKTTHISKHHRERKTLMKKRAKLKKRLKSCNRPEIIQNLISSIESDILCSHKNERLYDEELAVGRIKTDSNFFFRFAKKFSITKQDIGPFYDGAGDLINADDITITSTHTSMSAARKYIQPYLHKVYDWTQHNNLIINPDKTTCTQFTPDPAEYNSNLGLNINNKALPMALHPKVLGLTLDPKLTYNAHIQNIATHAQKPLQVIKAFTGTTWGKQKETLVATYKAVMRPTLEYASSIWSPMASPTSINKLQVIQNAALRACTGCTHDTNIQHLHDETNILPIQKHLQLHASQVRQKAQYPSHPLYRYTTHNNPQRLMKPTTFNNSRYTTNIPTDPCTVTTADIKANMRDIHTTIVSQHLAARDNNKILRTHPPQVSSTEENLPRHTRRTLAQLRTNKSPFLLSYLHKIDASTHPSPLCPLCSIHEHTTQHLFSCPQIPTTLSALDLWRDPSGVAALLDDWREKLATNPHQTTEADSPQ